MQEIDIEVLCETRYDDLLKVFPREKFGLTRGELREMKRQHKKVGRQPRTPAQELKSDQTALKAKATVTSLKGKMPKLSRSSQV